MDQISSTDYSFNLKVLIFSIPIYIIFLLSSILYICLSEKERAGEILKFEAIYNNKGDEKISLFDSYYEEKIEIIEMIIDGKVIDDPSYSIELDSGIHKATITLNITNHHSLSFLFGYCSALYSIKFLEGTDTSKIYDFTSFLSSGNLQYADVSNLNTSNARNMTKMFSSYSLTSLDLSNFNTSNVLDMRYMFYYSSSLTSLNLSNFDVKKVLSMEGMFYYCSNLESLDLSNFETNSVKNLDHMFYCMDKLEYLDISSFVFKMKSIYYFIDLRKEYGILKVKYEFYIDYIADGKYDKLKNWKIILVE